MKKLIKRLFPGLTHVYNRVYNYIAHYRFRNLAIEQVFSTIYKENHWGDKESKSGTGSNFRNTQTVVQIFNNIRQKLQITTVLDIPCGDYNWMKLVDKNGLTYIGADIVQELIDNNRKAYGASGVTFEKLNLTESKLPTVDVVFCRDCLVHFSYADIRKAFRSIVASESKYFATTTFTEHKNHDIITGDWRPLNLQGAPFNLPAPILIESEDCTEDDMERYKDKSIAVWPVAVLLGILNDKASA